MILKVVYFIISQVRSRRLQFIIMVIIGSYYSRSPFLLTCSHSSSNATVSGSRGSHMKAAAINRIWLQGTNIVVSVATCCWFLNIIVMFQDAAHDDISELFRIQTCIIDCNCKVPSFERKENLKGLSEKLMW